MSSLHTVYRPATFKEVVGHDSVVLSLKKIVKEGRAHSFIFTGPSGVGKTTMARILANEFARKRAKDTELKATIANVIEIDAATHTGVDAMREVVKKANYRAIGNSPVKAIIVDEAHRISGAAFDSLLKAIEEPPSHVYWFFCTTNGSKIPKTVRTRCASFDLQPLTEDEILLVLNETCEKAKVEIDDEIMELISENCGGSPRQALVWLEEVQFCETPAEARRVIRASGESKDVNDLIKLLLKGHGAWADAMRICADLEKDNIDAESVRIIACNYIGKVMSGLKDNKHVARHALILDSFLKPYDAAAKYAPLYHSLAMAMALDR